MNKHDRFLLALAALVLIALPGSAADIAGVIVRINATTGVVVVDNPKSFRAHQLTITPAQSVKALEVGQTVQIDRNTKSLVTGQGRLTISRAAALDVRDVKVISADRRTGVVRAEFINGGITRLELPPEAVAKLGLQPGQTVPLASMASAAAGSKPRCICGQKPDGTCWCVTDITYCCGVKLINCRCDRERRDDIYPPWGW